MLATLNEHSDHASRAVHFYLSENDEKKMSYEEKRCRREKDVDEKKMSYEEARRLVEDVYASVSSSDESV